MIAGAIFFLAGIIAWQNAGETKYNPSDTESFFIVLAFFAWIMFILCWAGVINAN